MIRLLLAVAALAASPALAYRAPDGWSRKVSIGRRADDMIAGWPSRAESAARAMIDKYGDPDEATEDALVWYGNGPWKKTVVRRSAGKLYTGIVADDCIENTLAYGVPRNKIAELGRFGEHVDANPDSAELSARSESEAVNFLTVNLAVEIARGKLTAEAARVHYTRLKDVPSSPYLTSLLLDPRR